MTDQTLKYISVHTLTNRFEADLLMGALQQEEIPVMLRSFEETPYDGLFVSQRGWGLIMVPEDFASRAREVITPIIQEIHTKSLFVDPSELDPLLWEDLRQADPEKICTAAQVRYDFQKAAYNVPFLETSFLCSPGEQKIELSTPSPYHKLNFELHLVTLHYLLESQMLGLSGNWISEKDIPGGQLFFRGPHKFPVEPLLELFGSRPDVFSSSAELLGGMKVAGMGDVAYRFWAFPRVPLLFLLWEGDDEFEPVMHIRFDSTITSQLHALDTIWALVNVVCRSLRAAARHVLGINA